MVSLRCCSSVSGVGASASTSSAGGRLNRISSFFSDIGEGNTTGSFNPFKDFILYNYKDNKDQVDSLFAPIKDHIFYSALLSRTRKSWSGVPSGAGSQSCYYNWYMELNKAILELAEEGVKKYGECDW